MFSFVIVYTVTTLELQSISFIDNREFPGTGGVIPSGPVGYQLSVYSDAIGIIPQAMYLLNTLLADGLLVSTVSDSCTRVSNAGHFSSCIAAISFMP
jgi:hypothetical protein